MFCKVLIVNRLRFLGLIVTKNHVEKCCDLRQITAHSDSKRKAKSVKWQGKVTEIANERGRNGGIEGIKWRRTNGEMASYRQGMWFFFSIGSRHEVLKTRKKVDRENFASAPCMKAMLCVNLFKMKYNNELQVADLRIICITFAGENKYSQNAIKMDRLPNDPMILFSAVNMLLRDNYGSLDALCDDMNVNREELETKLATVGFEYDKTHNKFW